MLAYIHGAIPLLPLLPLLAPLSSPFVSPSTYLAPSRCDRNRPSSSQVACELTPFVPSTQLTHPPLSRSPNPSSPAPNNDDDLGNILALDIQYKYGSHLLLDLV